MKYKESDTYDNTSEHVLQSKQNIFEIKEQNKIHIIGTYNAF